VSVTAPSKICGRIRLLDGSLQAAPYATDSTLSIRLPTPKLSPRRQMANYLTGYDVDLAGFLHGCRASSGRDAAVRMYRVAQKSKPLPNDHNRIKSY